MEADWAEEAVLAIADEEEWISGMSDDWTAGMGRPSLRATVEAAWRWGNVPEGHGLARFAASTSRARWAIELQSLCARASRDS